MVNEWPRGGGREREREWEGKERERTTWKSGPYVLSVRAFTLVATIISLSLLHTHTHSHTQTHTNRESGVRILHQLATALVLLQILQLLRVGTSVNSMLFVRTKIDEIKIKQKFEKIVGTVCVAGFFNLCVFVF